MAIKDQEIDRILARLGGLPPLRGDESYQEMLEPVAQVLLWEDIGSYQGDYYVLLESPSGAIGYTTIGYGSCSGCDALQAAQDYGNDGPSQDMIDLRDRIIEGIQWFDNAAEAHNWFEKHDWRGDWTGYYGEDQKGFVTKAKQLLADKARLAA